MNLLSWRAYFFIHTQTNIEMSNVKAVIEQLGILCKNEYPNSKEKSQKIGIRKIYNTLGQKIPKRQIKKFINLFATKGDRIRIPYKSMIIFDALVKLIDNNDKLCNYCKYQCLTCMNRQDSEYCREKFIPSFYDFVSIHSNQFNERARYEILEPMMNFYVKCK